MLSTCTILATPLSDYGARYQVISGVSDTHGVWRTSRVSLTPIDILPQVGPLVPRVVIYPWFTWKPKWDPRVGVTISVSRAQFSCCSYTQGVASHVQSSAICSELTHFSYVHSLRPLTGLVINCAVPRFQTLRVPGQVHIYLAHVQQRS